MDASTLAKSAKALILVSGLIAASTVIGAAQDAPIALGATATVPLNSWYVAPPTGQAPLGGHTFDLTAGNLIMLANGQSVSFTGSYAGAKGAYLLVNTSNTYSFYTGMVIGKVVLTFSDATTLSTDLTVGSNIREWRIGAGATANTVVPGAGSTQAWAGTAQPAMGGGTAVIDMLSIPVTTAGKTLTTVTVNDTNSFGSALKMQLAGVTVDWTAPTPTPTPTPAPTCTMNDHAGKTAADKAKNVPHCIAKGKDAEKADTEKTDTKKADTDKADTETVIAVAAQRSDD
jgi:hypothetical protein